MYTRQQPMLSKQQLVLSKQQLVLPHARCAGICTLQGQPQRQQAVPQQLQQSGQLQCGLGHLRVPRWWVAAAQAAAVRCQLINSLGAANWGIHGDQHAGGYSITAVTA
jgi:hypothetical protein